MEYGYRKKITVLWVILVIVLLLGSNVATYYITSRMAASAPSEDHSYSSDEYTEAKVEKLVYLIDKLEENFLWDIDEEEMWNSIYKGLMSGTGDIYSEYMTEEEYKEYQETLEGSYSGIGIQMTNDDTGNIRIVTVYKDTPAYEAGLQVGDYIASADDVSLLGESSSYAVSFIRGPEGTSVQLGIIRDGSEFYVDVKRATIEMVYVTNRMIGDDIGYINISEFETNTYDQFAKAMKEMEEEGMKGLILDLRQNPGGLVSEAVQIADDLLPKCQVIYTMNRRGERSSYDSDARCTDIPLVVLVDEYSASSSEILTVALKDNERADIVGTTSYGKGIVQILIPLNDGSLYKYTYAEYFSSKGTKIHGVGITPDYVVEPMEEYRNTVISDIPYEYDLQLQKAVEVLEVKIGQ